MYWRYLQSDRNLYLPNDTVSVWGFLKSRYTDEKINEVTLEIASNNWFYFDYKFAPNMGDGTAYESIKLKVVNGFYEGGLELPNLEPGSYQVNVKMGKEIVSSTYIQVEKYVKPEYKIEVTADKKAIFIGEPIQFKAKTAFFEGTPVANLEVNYNFSGLDYQEGNFKTNQMGENTIDYTPQYVEGYQGTQYGYFSAYATLPESGQISASKEFQIYVNNIEVQFTTTLKDGKGVLNAEVHKIDLTPLNDEDPENDSSYLSNPVPGLPISGIVYRNEWKKREIGQYYDFINKVIVPQYDYYTDKTVFQNVTTNTDAAGKAIVNLQLPEDKNVYYTVELSTQDLSGRSMKFEQYFGEMWQYSPYDYNRFYLKSEKETFSVGDSVDVQFMNNEEPVTGGSFLYVSAQNGIYGYEVSNSSKYNTTFDGQFVPNAEISGVYFNGKTYIPAESFNARLDVENNRIVFTAELNQATYKPGETAVVSLKATIFSKATNSTIGAKGVSVNISIVDEALFQLSDQSIDTLEVLFEWVPSGINSTYGSHKNDGYNSMRPMVAGMGGMVKEEAAYDMASEAPAMNASRESSESQKSDGGAIRSEFKDTAFFTSIKLDENGLGTFSFKLPDNVTSWRMTFAGISEELMAGTNIEQCIVTLPYFINTTLNTTYLEGDQ
ncbi:MAG: hypothetical protein H7X94_05245, partial [Vallitaleaceae bacterium]|nr:hypothetical protein [Vallitaleaceae bacterium]